MIQGHEEFVLNQEMRDARILEKTKILSELTQQRDTLQSRMAETHTSKEEETYQNILSRIAEIEADLAEEGRILRVAPLALNAIPPNTSMVSSETKNLAASTPEEYKDEEIQHQHRMEGTPVYKEDKLTRAGATSTFGPQLANEEEVRAQAYRELLNDKQKLQSLEGLIKRLHQLFVNSFDPKAFDLYIEPQVKDRDTGVEYSAFKRLRDFLVQADAASMLVAGDPGMGKTLLSLQIAQQSWYLFIRKNVGSLLKDSYWANVLASYEKQGFAQIVAPLFSPTDEKSEEPATEKTISLPLWLWMPFLRTEKDWEQRLLETYLKQSGLFPEDIALLKQVCQQHLLHLLPIMDGWDELPPVKENLYLRSGFWEEEHWPYLKVLSTCRPEAFVHYEKQGGYKSIFHPKQGVGAYTILNLSPFEPRHIDAYVNRYVSILPEDYQPSISSPMPDVLVGQARAWDQAKAAWCAAYEARYFPLPKTAKPQDEKKDGEEASAAAVDLPVSEQPINWRIAQTYQYYLEHIPGLSNLIQTPFVLSAVIQILPSVVTHQVQQGESQPSITRYKIYQYFVDYWLTAQAKRLWQDKEKQWDLVDFRMESEVQSIEKLKACLFTYSENLACLALNLGGGKIEVNLTDKDTLNPNFVIPASGALHFKEELVDVKKLQLIRSGCLLQNLGNNFKFLHKSLVEFFAAKALFSGAHIAADSYLQRFDIYQNLKKNFSLNKQLLTLEPNIIHLLADQARDDLNFKYLLYQIIELSKGEPAVEKAAANAITILNAAGESFSGRDFRGIHIRGAILNGALCDQADFEGADLRDVTAHNAWLQKANLSHAQVSGLDLQELPRIKHSAIITSSCIASHARWLLIGDEKGYVTQYDYLAGKQLRQWNLNSSQSECAISSLVLHPDEELTAISCGRGVQLINIRNSKWEALFKPLDNGGNIKKGRFGYFNFIYSSNCIAFCYTQGQYLLFNVKIIFYEAERAGDEKIYEMEHLQLWDIKQHRFLGEYIAKHRFNQLLACCQGCILIGKTQDDRILLFSILDHTQGPLIPSQELCGGDYFTLSRDEKLLAVSEKNTIRFYQTHFCGPLSNIFQLKEKECEVLAFNYEGNLLAVKSATQLHIWDLKSGRELYTLPVPTKEGQVKSKLYFLPSISLLHVFISVGDTLYNWSLSRTVISVCYPYRLINLSLQSLVKLEHSRDPIYKISSIKGKLWNLLNARNKSEGVKHHGTIDESYLVTSTIKKALNISLTYRNYLHIYVWDLYKQRLHFTFTCNHVSNCNHLLSVDKLWLVTLVWGEAIFIHRLEDGKELVKFFPNLWGKPPYLNKPRHFVLSANKRWLAVAESSNCISIFDVTISIDCGQQQRVSYLVLPIIIWALSVTTDSQFLIIKDKKERDLIFRVIPEEEALTVRLVNSTMELSLVCDEVNIKGVCGLSQENLLLLGQNDAHGISKIPSFSAGNVNENKQSEVDMEIGREFSFDRAIVRRDNVSSFLNSRAVLSYGLWQVALVRDRESRNNSEHTFIVVEGMDAFGRCSFWRFDLVTKIGEETVEKGFAKVNIQRYNDLLLSERESILQVFLNPHEIQGRGLESLVGHVWQLKREKVLDLYKAIMADQAKGLLPYALTGNQSFFSTGDNCYSWARRHLLALKEPKIQKELPSTSADYFVMRPKWKLQESLVAAQHAKREAASGPCRPM
jgi:WD40 repeat protein